ncbi:hypothetical protein GGR50DRAFT_513018 [Xylaria sp. CBS 124048]|nr:hypothetical protein GGR50DRAFT_513018 [Xylaria sp. CBS 124048]
MPRLSSGMARPSAADLEQAAISVVHLMRGVPGLASVRLALIGDLAVQKYLGQSGPCESIEFVTKSVSPSLVKKSLLSHGNGTIVERAPAIFYRHSTGWLVEVKVTPEWLYPYFPSSAQMVADIRKLPYISLVDLFIFKADACGLHESDEGRQKEARDACALLALASEHFPLKLDDDKLQRVEEALDTLVTYSPSENDRRWWERRLGKKQCDMRRSVQDILSELGEGLRLDGEENRRTGRRPSLFSLHNWSPDMSQSPSPPLPSQSNASANINTNANTNTNTPTQQAKTRPRKMSVTAHPRPRRHTQTAIDPRPRDRDRDRAFSPAQHSYPDVNQLHAEFMITGGRNSPGISLMTFPGREG